MKHAFIRCMQFNVRKMGEKNPRANSSKKKILPWCDVVQENIKRNFGKNLFVFVRKGCKFLNTDNCENKEKKNI